MNLKEKEYSHVLYRAVLNSDSLQGYQYYEQIAIRSEKFTLAIPDEWIYARIMGTAYGYNPYEIKKQWEQFAWVDSVVIYDKYHSDVQTLLQICEFNEYFIGNEYGKKYINDKYICDKMNIKMHLIAPDKYVQIENRDALEVALKNVLPGKKIVCYGAGVYFQKYMQKFGSKYPPEYVVDQKEENWNTNIDKISVYSPQKLFEDDRDILVVICCKNYSEIRDLILSKGKFDYRTMLYSNDLALIDEVGIALEQEEEYMEQVRPVLKQLMCEFDRVCRKYELKYYVISGSLIGVVRHKGMIPWDDDIDIGMPREDLEKLKKIADAEWNGERFLFVNYSDVGEDIFHDLMPRLFYMGAKFPTKTMDKASAKKINILEQRMILDIYPLDNASDNEKKHSFNMFRIKFIYNLLMGHRGKIDYEEYSRLPKRTLRVIKMLNKIGNKIPIKILIKWMDKSIQCENKNITSKYYMSSGPIMYVERTFQKKYFGQGQEMDFEGMKVMVPQDYDSLLHAEQYGNYMELPAYECRKPSHYFNADISIW